jgi:hypothetical protein
MLQGSSSQPGPQPSHNLPWLQPMSLSLQCQLQQSSHNPRHQRPALWQHCRLLQPLPTLSTSGTVPKPQAPAPTSSSCSSSARSSAPPIPPPEHTLSTRQLRPSKNIDYWELHLGKQLLLGQQEFIKRCSSTWKSVGKAIQTTVNKRRKIAEEHHFPAVSCHSSSSSTASSKWLQGRAFWIRTWNSSMRNILALQNQNYSSKTSAVMRPPLRTSMYESHSILQLSSTPKHWLQVYMLNYLTSTKNLSRPLSSLSPTSACLPSRAAWKIFGT